MNKQKLALLKHDLLQLEQEQTKLSKRVESGNRNITIGSICFFICCVIFFFYLNNEALIVVGFILSIFVILIPVGIVEVLSSIKLKKVEKQVMITKQEIITLENT